MTENEDEDLVYYPKTLHEAVYEFMSLDLTASDEEVITQCPPERLHWLHSNFEREIKSICLLDHNNKDLIANCCPDNPNATADDVSLIIMEAIRIYFQTGEMPK
jgi:hypothetical protein